jgi:hypothetical protein
VLSDKPQHSKATPEVDVETAKNDDFENWRPLIAKLRNECFAYAA